jgi:prevent-host-death family protein
MEIAAGKFKSVCLKILDEVNESRQEVIITKRGKPVAKLVPVEPKPPRPLFGYMKGTVEIVGDIISPSGEKWEAER